MLEWVSWFNHHRLLEPIGYLAPAEAEANHDRQIHAQARMAWLRRRRLLDIRGSSLSLESNFQMDPPKIGLQSR